MTSAGRALVSGMICAEPHQGGATWAVLQFLLGLRRLGWKVHFVETLDRRSLRPAGAALEVSENAAYLAATMAEFGLDYSWTLLERGGGSSAGVPPSELRRFSGGADLLLNLSGVLTEETLLGTPRLRVYVDLDPAFTQLWHSAVGIDMGLGRHDRFVTVGRGIGEAGCSIPTCGLDWIKIAPPVVLEQWPAAPAEARPEMTTVGHWRGYGSIEHAGLRYGQRVHTMRRLMALPSLTSQPLLLALAIHAEETPDLEALAASGWRIISPASVAFDTSSYRDFVSSSRAEIGIPKSGYVDSRSGWFSDRSACYLAAGRPVVTASTGFERHLPVGEGLLAFEDAEGAAECIAAVNSDYARHSAAARAIAVEHLDSDRVLGEMLDAAFTREVARC